MSEETLFDAVKALLRAYGWPVYRVEKVAMLVGMPPGTSSVVWITAQRRAVRNEVDAMIRELRSHGATVLVVSSLTETIEELEKAGLVQPTPPPLTIAQPRPLPRAA